MFYALPTILHSLYSAELQIAEATLEIEWLKAEGELL